MLEDPSNWTKIKDGADLNLVLPKRYQTALDLQTYQNHSLSWREPRRYERGRGNMYISCMKKDQK